MNYEKRIVYQSSNRIIWQIVSDRYLAPNEIDHIVESNYPSPGYGASWVSLPYMEGSTWIIEVKSNASCD